MPNVYIHHNAGPHEEYIAIKLNKFPTHEYMSTATSFVCIYIKTLSLPLAGG
jgi:hypothetical protein